MGFRHILTTHPLIGKLPPEEIDALVGIGREIGFPRHHVIQRIGETPRGLYLLIDGFVKLSRTSEDGRELILAIAGPDQLFGPCCQPLRACGAPCVAEARTKVRAILLPMSAWMNLLRTRPATSHVVLDALLSSRSGCANLAQDLAFLDLEARLAKLLLYLGQWSRPDAAGQILVPQVLSQWELASGIGTAREVVTRKLQQMEDSGIIGRRKRQIVIRDVAALRALAGPVPAATE